MLRRRKSTTLLLLEMRIGYSTTNGSRKLQKSQSLGGKLTLQVTCNKIVLRNIMTFFSKKAVFVALLLIACAVLTVGIFYARSKSLQPSVHPLQKLQVVATFYPLAYFAEQVGGDLVEVMTIVPSGIEPHDYEPTPQDLAKLYNADVVLVNGNGIDPWASKIVDDLRKQGIRTLRMSDELESIGSADPHFWLDPILAKQSADLIGRPLFVSLRNSGAVELQLREFVTRLDELHEQYQTGLAECKQREFVTTHNAFAYLAKRYNLTQHPISDISLSEDPSPQTMAEISDLVKQKGITTIFFETLVSPKTAQTIATETGAQTAVLNPIEGVTSEETQAGKGYLQLMQENLLHLKTALQCT